MPLAEVIGHPAEDNRALEPGFLQASELGRDTLMEWRLNRLQPDD
jgi:hypothetical protein